jgi:hypothetical protein
VINSPFINQEYKKIINMTGNIKSKYLFFPKRLFNPDTEKHEWRWLKKCSWHECRIDDEMRPFAWVSEKNCAHSLSGYIMRIMLNK